MKKLCEISVDRNEEGMRLDRLISRSYPNAGLRGARRLINSGCVKIDGKDCSSRRKLREGERIAIFFEEPQTPPCMETLKEDKDFIFLKKPMNVHSVRIAGKNAPCAEDWLIQTRPENEKFFLAQRLDYRTSGILLAAKNGCALHEFRAIENAGECGKFYLALLDGRPESPLTAKKAIDASKRAKSRVISCEGAALRHTEFYPLFFFNNEIPEKLRKLLTEDVCKRAREKGLTLAACRIRKGTRHQIRAHAASLGFPLAGDGLYNPDSREIDEFFLHQAMLRFGSRCCIDLPSWLPDNCIDKAQNWLRAV